MSTATQLAGDWQKGTGRDASHSARLIRALQVAELSPVGKQGKAALLTSSALTYFVLADATGDSIFTAAQRATTWGGIVRDYSSGVVVGRGRTQTEISWRTWRDSVRGEAEATDPNALHNILPGATLLEGLSALLDRMADLTPNVPTLGDKLVSFKELVINAGFHIALHVGENEGPTAIVYVGGRSDRYSMRVQPAVARFPIKSVITIEVRHLIVLAHVLEAAKARTTSAQSVPPVPPASPAGPGNGNAGAVPTAPAPTPDHPSSPADRTAAHALQEPSSNSSELRVCGRACARAAKGVPYSQLAHKASLDDIFAVFDTAHIG